MEMTKISKYGELDEQATIIRKTRRQRIIEGKRGTQYVGCIANHEKKHMSKYKKERMKIFGK